MKYFIILVLLLPLFFIIQKILLGVVITRDNMLWQDYAITIIIYMFVIVTIPQVIDVLHKKTKLNLLTASLTAIGNYLLAVVFATLGLWISVTSSLFIASLWLIIFIGSARN